MSRNGSGTYVLPSGNPVVTGTTITSNWANTTLSDIATALTGSVAADGQTPMTGALDMTNNKITNLADGVALTDAATVNQISNPNIIGGSIDNTPIGNISPSTGKFTTLSANAGVTLSGTCTAPTVTPGSDNSTNIATTAFVQSAISAVSSGVTSFNTRTGNVTLTNTDVTTALGYTPYNAAGATIITTGNISTYAPGPTGSGASGNWAINITGNAQTATSAGTATTATNASGLTGSPSITVSGITTPAVNTSSGTLSLSVGGTQQVSVNTFTFFPNADNTLACGGGSNRWNVVYAATGTINTSDANEKQQIADLTAAEKAVGLALKGMIKSFKFNEAVKEKGANARVHFGVIAQDVKTAFESQGLDANKYGVFCSDTLPNGTIRLGVRYEELFSLILGAL